MGLAEVRARVRKECERKDNAFGPSFFDQHLTVVAAHGSALAACLGAKAEIVEAAAYLHDISAVRDLATLPDHAQLSAAIAAEILSEEGYPQAFTDEVVDASGRTGLCPVTEVSVR